MSKLGNPGRGWQAVRENTVGSCPIRRADSRIPQRAPKSILKAFPENSVLFWRVLSESGPRQMISLKFVSRCAVRPLPLLLAFFGLVHEAGAQGPYVPVSGPVNRGMGGASTAAPLDAIGAMYWNPATISGLKTSEMGFGMDFIFADHEVASSLGPFSGSTEGEPGVAPVPSFALVHRGENPMLTYGLAVSGVAGFKTDISGTGNPILFPQPFGLGQVSSEASILELTPVVSLQLTDRLFVSAGPIIGLGQIGVQPFVFDSPNTDGIYPSGRTSRYHWGGGVQAGAYFVCNDAWQFGASVKSPVWFQTFEIPSTDANGLPRTLYADVDLPLIVSLGTAYTGLENWVVAADVRYLDYANAEGLGDPASFDANGALRGLGFDSVFAAAVGVQRQLNDCVAARMGYGLNQNPISDSESVFNTASPLIYEHFVNFGLSLNLTRAVKASLAYTYIFENEVTGPIVSPVLGTIPGSSVTNRLNAHVISIGVSTTF
jgi:long-chain fatty acid transport protein